MHLPSTASIGSVSPLLPTPPPSSSTAHRSLSLKDRSSCARHRPTRSSASWSFILSPFFPTPFPFILPFKSGLNPKLDRNVFLSPPRSPPTREETPSPFPVSTSLTVPFDLPYCSFRFSLLNPVSFPFSFGFVDGTWRETKRATTKR